MTDLSIFKGKCVIVTGHFGSGKTTFSANLAARLSSLGIDTVAVDIDTVNPYFRLADSEEFLKEHGADLIVPNFANTNVDIPSLPSKIYSVFPRVANGGCAVFDVGGDFTGASPIGMLRSRITAAGYVMLYVVNASRPLTETPADALAVLSEIEERSGLKASFFVNNTNLSDLTDREVIASGEEYAKEFAKISSLPCLFTAAMADHGTEFELFKMKNTTKKIFTED